MNEQTIEVQREFTEQMVAVSQEPITVGGVQPSGTKEITENGTYDVSQYAQASVNVGGNADGIIDGTIINLANDTATKVKREFASIAKKYNYRNLPEGYTQVEYIESHGTEYLDTGALGAYPVRAHAVMEWVQVPSDGDLLGARDAQNRLYLFHIYGGWCLGFGGFYSSQINPAVGKKYDVVMQVQNGYQQLTIDEAPTRQWTNSAVFTLTHNFYLFAMNYGGSPSAFVKAKVYELQIRNGATAIAPLVCDLVPCIKDATGEYGMFDMISQTFKGNLGTGAFTGGEVVPNLTYGYTSADLAVTEIGDYAFYNNDLASLTLRANQVVVLGENAIEGTPIAEGTGYIYVPSELLTAYQADSAWSAYTSQLRAI